MSTLSAALLTAPHFPGIAHAQAPPEPPPGPQVYLDDSFEVAETIDRARALMERQTWTEAAERLQRTLEDFGDKLIQVDQGRFISVRRHIAGMLCAWPENGRKVYQRNFDSVAQERLAAAAERRDVAAMLAEFDRYFCLPSAARAADTLGLLALEAGHFALAERVYLRVLDEHPDRAALEGPFRERLRLIAAMQGRRFDDQPLEGSLRWKGTDRPLTAVMKDITETFDPPTDALLDGDWTMLGGNTPRNRRGTQALDDLGLLWQFDLDEPGSTRHGLADFAETRGSRFLARRMSAHPVVAGDRVFVQFHRDLFAMNTVSGLVLWQYRGGNGAWAASEFDDLAAGCDAPTWDRRRVFAVLPGAPNAVYGSAVRRTPPGIICLDARDGTLLWRVDRDSLPGVLGDIDLDASPLVHQDTVAVIGRRRRSFGFEDCYLFRFHAQSGRFLSRTHLGSASTGSFGSRQTTLAMIAADGDTLYAHSNLGTVAAVAADTGEIRWLRLYPRVGPAGVRVEAWNSDEVEPWALNPPLLEGDALVLLPNDSANLLWLDKDDGSLRRAVPSETLFRPRTILGLHDGILCTVGQQVGCYHLVEDHPVWFAPLPGGLEPFGRGQWIGDELLVPTRAGLSRFRVADGQRTDLAWSGGEIGGNVLSLSGQLFVAGVSGLSSYVRKEELWRKLHDALSAAPKDPLPALEASEVALRGGDHAEATRYLLEAVRRADGLDDDLTDDLRSRIFRNLLTFPEILRRRGELSVDSLDEFCAHAPHFAPRLSAHVAYRAVFAALYHQASRADKALDLYQQILRDRSLRELLVAVDAQGMPLIESPSSPNPRSNAEQDATAVAGSGEIPAAAYAESRIAALLREHGREIYAPYETEARRRLDAARDARRIELLADVADVFPNADAALEAELTRADLLQENGALPDAVAHLTRAYRRAADPAAAVRLLDALVRAHARAGDRLRAFRWLTLATRRHPEATVSLDGRPVTFSDYRLRFEDMLPSDTPARPDIQPPLTAPFTQTFPDNVRILSPRFPNAPGADFSRYYILSNGLILAHDARTHRDLWPQGQKARAEAELLVARPDAALFSTRFEIIAIDPHTGRILWSHGQPHPAADNPDADWENFAGLRRHALHADRLLSLDDRGTITCLNLPDGRLLWNRKFPAAPVGILELGDDSALFAYADQNHILLRRIDPRTGDSLGLVSFPETRPVERILLTLDGRAVVLTAESIYSLDPETGTSFWSLTLRDPLRQASLTIDLDTLYFTDDGRVVRKLRLGDGRLLWESEPLTRRGDTDLQIDRLDGHLIVSTSEEVLALDESSGVILWRGIAPDGARFTHRAVGRDFVVAVHQGAKNAEGALPGPMAFFYDLRNRSGALAKNGGILELGDLDNLSEFLALDGSIVLRTGQTIRAWSAEPAP